MWRSKMKGETISHEVFKVVFYQGILKGNQTPMKTIQDSK